MATKQGQGKGKKSRKFGRKRDSLAQQRYTSSRRWETNKRRKAQKYANHMCQSVRIKISGVWETIQPNKIKNAGEKSPAP